MGWCGVLLKSSLRCGYYNPWSVLPRSFLFVQGSPRLHGCEPVVSTTSDGRKDGVHSDGKRYGRGNRPLRPTSLGWGV